MPCLIGSYFQINQEILSNTDIIEVLVDVIDSKEQLPAVLVSSFNCLRAMCFLNADIQMRLFHIIHHILHCKAGRKEKGWENAMADLVAEIFHDNKDICNHVKGLPA